MIKNREPEAWRLWHDKSHAVIKLLLFVVNMVFLEAKITQFSFNDIWEKNTYNANNNLRKKAVLT